MTKKLLAAFALVLVFSVALGTIAFAGGQAQEKRLYDANGNEVFGGGVLYDDNRVPVFGPGCWYYCDDGKPVDARGMEAFMYDSDGALVPAPYGSWCRGYIGNGGRRWGGGSRGRGGCCRQGW